MKWLLVSQLRKIFLWAAVLLFLASGSPKVAELGNWIVLYYTIPHILLLCQNLAPTLHTMQLDHQQFSQNQKVINSWLVSFMDGLLNRLTGPDTYDQNVCMKWLLTFLCSQKNYCIEKCKTTTQRLKTRKNKAEASFCVSCVQEPIFS